MSCGAAQTLIDRLVGTLCSGAKQTSAEHPRSVPSQRYILVVSVANNRSF
jgi:hypothetical protein